MTNIPVTVAKVYNKLVGLRPWLDKAANIDSPHTYGEPQIQAAIPGILRRFERDTNITIMPTQYTTDIASLNSTVLGGQLSPYPVVEIDPGDYYEEMAREYFPIKLPKRPIRTVQLIEIKIGSQSIFKIPPEWYSVKKRAGHFSVLPVYGPALIAANTIAFAQLTMTFGPRGYMPNALHQHFIAGLPDGFETAYEFADLIYVLESYVALEVLKHIAELADAGLVGVSMGGGPSSESYNYSRFQSRKAELEADVKSFQNTWTEQEGGNTFLLGGV